MDGLLLDKPLLVRFASIVLLRGRRPIRSDADCIQIETDRRYNGGLVVGGRRFKKILNRQDGKSRYKNVDTKTKNQQFMVWYHAVLV